MISDWFQISALVEVIVVEHVEIELLQKSLDILQPLSLDKTDMSQYLIFLTQQTKYNDISTYCTNS